RGAGSAGTGSAASRSSAQRKAASVLPDPVGATTSVFSPHAIDVQAPACACVGALNAPVNHSLVTGLNPARGSAAMAGMYPSCLVPPTNLTARQAPVLTAPRTLAPCG